MLSWFTSDDNVPPLIDSANLDISPWASFALLLAEQLSHEAFYEILYQAMSKHPKSSLDQSVKVYLNDYMIKFILLLFSPDFIKLN